MEAWKHSSAAPQAGIILGGARVRRREGDRETGGRSRGAEGSGAEKRRVEAGGEGEERESFLLCRPRGC